MVPGPSAATAIGANSTTAAASNADIILFMGALKLGEETLDRIDDGLVMLLCDGGMFHAFNNGDFRGDDRPLSVEFRHEIPNVAKRRPVVALAVNENELHAPIGVHKSCHVHDLANLAAGSRHVILERGIEIGTIILENAPGLRQSRQYEEAVRRRMVR